MIEREPEEVVSAVVSVVGAGYLVTLIRADGERVPILCGNAQGAADLIDRMNPATTDVAIAQCPARWALFDALGTEDVGTVKATLH